MSIAFRHFPATQGLAQLAEAEGVAAPLSLAALARAGAALGLARGWTVPTAGFANALAEIGWERLGAGAPGDARRAFDHALAGRRLCVSAQTGLARLGAPGVSS